MNLMIKSICFSREDSKHFSCKVILQDPIVTVASNSHNEMENFVTMLKCAPYYIRLGWPRPKDVGYMLLLTYAYGYSHDAACRVYFTLLHIITINQDFSKECEKLFFLFFNQNICCGYTMRLFF